MTPLVGSVDIEQAVQSLADALRSAVEGGDTQTLQCLREKKFTVHQRVKGWKNVFQCRECGWQRVRTLDLRKPRPAKAKGR